MKQSMRVRRMARHHKRLSKNSRLNLVSLMDIFTILVFFLLVNSDMEVLQTGKEIKLPESTAEQKPELTLLIAVNNTDLLVSGRGLAKVEELLAESTGEEQKIAALEQELKYQIERRPELTELEKKRGRAVTIMGDQSVPYKLLKRIMVTCAANEYRHISLAVSRVPLESPAETQPPAEPAVDTVAAIGHGQGR